jgi:hypothetical protein
MRSTAHAFVGQGSTTLKEVRWRGDLRQLLVLALLVCLNAGRPALRLNPAEPGAAASFTQGGTAAIAASPAKSLSGGDSVRVQWIRDAAKAPGQSTFAAHQAVSLRTPSGLSAAAANLQADEIAELWRPALLHRGRAPPSLSRL